MYSAVPLVPSEKNNDPSLDVPDLNVIPVLPDVAMVKSSAPPAPSVVVPMSNLPLVSNRALS